MKRKTIKTILVIALCLLVFICILTVTILTTKRMPIYSNETISISPTILNKDSDNRSFMNFNTTTRIITGYRYVASPFYFILFIMSLTVFAILISVFIEVKEEKT